MNEKTDICLVNMPFDMIYGPSLALGLLKKCASDAGLKTKVDYANLNFVNMFGDDIYKWRLWGEELGHAMEMFFLPFAGYEKYHSTEEIVEWACGYYRKNKEKYREVGDICINMRDDIDKFLDDTADRIISMNPSLVGCTYSFQQCNSILSLLKRIKSKRPDIVTVIGGCGMTENAAPIILDNMPQIDYGFLGESDDIFADACALMIRRDVETLFSKYNCVAKKGIRGHAHAVKSMDVVPCPDYDDYFDRIKELGMDCLINPSLFLEGSRGCWWGQKQKCAFCGLHSASDSIVYRKKSSRRISEELEILSFRYGIKKFMFTDCILDYSHVEELGDLVIDKGYRMFAEVKSNLTREQLYSLHRAGFRQMQPGIESLSDEILKMIGKGNTAIRHIELLKNAKIAGIQLIWNMMCDHPGENPEWYYTMIERMKLLHHLDPPNGNHVVFQRNSRYTADCKKNWIDLKITDEYKYMFGFDESLLEQFAENFRYAKKPDDTHIWATFREIHSWQKDNQTVKLFYFVQNGIMGILDTRGCAVNNKYALDGVEKDICLACDSVISEKKLKENLSKYYDTDVINAGIKNHIDNKLIININGELLFLALPGRKAPICS